MRHFGHVTPEERQRLFHREPGVFTSDSPARILAAALGATLYSPATRPTLADDIVKACKYLEEFGGNAKPPTLHAKEKTSPKC